jgi:anti-sigma regulatory factor (Ser/Thr protein kinase)
MYSLNQKQISIPSDDRHIPRVEDEINNTLVGLLYKDQERSDVIQATDLALHNAIHYGNQGQPDKQVKILICASVCEVEVTITDEGHTYKMLDSHQKELLIPMYHHMSEVEISPGGNEVTLRKYRHA